MLEITDLFNGCHKAELNRSIKEMDFSAEDLKQLEEMGLYDPHVDVPLDAKVQAYEALKVRKSEHYRSADNESYTFPNGQPNFTVEIDLARNSFPDALCEADAKKTTFVTIDGKATLKHVTSHEVIGIPLPRTLMCKLKRAGYDNATEQQRKNDAKFEFPVEFDMAPRTGSPNVKQLYRLTGIVAHTGTINSGHYICYRLIDNRWYEFDDSRVTCVSEDAIKRLYGGQPGGLNAVMLSYDNEPAVSPEPINLLVKGKAPPKIFSIPAPNPRS
jgi:hypothetical protein